MIINNNNSDDDDDDDPDDGDSNDDVDGEVHLGTAGMKAWVHRPKVRSSRVLIRLIITPMSNTTTAAAAVPWIPN